MEGFIFESEDGLIGKFTPEVNEAVCWDCGSDLDGARCVECGLVIIPIHFIERFDA